MNDLEIAAKKFSVLERVPIGICVLREDFVVLFWNRCMEDWTDLCSHQIVGTNICDHFPHLGQAKYASRLQHIFAGGPPTIFSSQLHRHLIPAPLPDGQLRIQHTTVTAIPPATEEASFYAMLSIQDVTELTHRVQDYRAMRDQALAEVKERLRVQEELAKYQNHLEELVAERTAALFKANEQLRLWESVVINANDAIVVTEAEPINYPGPRILFVNEAYTRQTGYTPEEVIGQSPRILQGPKTDRAQLDKIRAALKKWEPIRIELINYRKDGSEFWVELNIVPIADENGWYTHWVSVQRDITERKVAEQALQQLASELEMRVEERTAELKRVNEQLMVEITERRQAEERIKASLEEKEVLLKEIHHRVKNNLQVISSLLQLQSRYTNDPQTLMILKESQNRVKSMALIHEKLYQSEDLCRIDFGDYIHHLAKNLLYSYSVDINTIQLSIDVIHVTLNLETAIPCGLFINELISNALKHAFPKGRKGKICITFERVDEQFLLIVNDNGIGLPEHVNITKNASLGLRLVNTFTTQLQGSIDLDRNNGTTFKLKFSELNYTQRI